MKAVCVFLGSFGVLGFGGKQDDDHIKSGPAVKI